MADLVGSILQAAAEKQSKLKSTDVQKDIDVEIDEGNLLSVDSNPLDIKKIKSNREEYLRELARENTQLLFNQIWQLPVERVEDAVIAKLPTPTTRLPREKPIPEAKKLTKWQQYAKEKGFTKRKKERMVYDEGTKEYRPRWGYKRINDMADKWVLEVPDTADPYQDQFEKLKKEKKERVAKNELQRLRNIARNMKGKMPGVGLTPAPAPSKDHVTKALHEARTSDASLGRFSKDLPKEKPAKNMGKKRKFEPNYGNSDAEKRRALDILGKIQNKKSALDVTQATNQEMRASEMAQSQSKGGKMKNMKMKKGAGGMKGVAGKKGVGAMKGKGGQRPAGGMKGGKKGAPGRKGGGGKGKSKGKSR